MLESTPAPKAVTENIFEKFVLTNQPNGATVVLPSDRAARASFYGYEVKELKLSGPNNFAGGQISVRAIGAAMPHPSLTTVEHSGRVQTRFFDGNLKPLSEEQTKAMFPYQRDRETFTDGVRPIFHFHFSATNVPEIKVLGGHVRDARTGAPVSHGYSSGSGEGGVHFGPWIAMWHRAPVILFLDIAYGPTEMEDLELKPGSKITHAQGELIYAAQLNGRNQGFSSSSSGRGNPTTYTLRQYTNDPASSFLFLAGPSSSSALPVELKFLTDTQQKHSDGANQSDGLIMYSVDAPFGSVTKIRVKKYPNLARLILRLPYLPGLPEQNADVKDLLKVEIPFVKFQGEWEMQSLIQQGTQLEVQHRTSVTVPNGYFPRTYTNTTVDAILEDFRSLHPPPARLVIKEKDNEIQIRDSFLKELLRGIGF